MKYKLAQKIEDEYDALLAFVTGRIKLRAAAMQRSLPYIDDDRSLRVSIKADVVELFYFSEGWDQPLYTSTTYPTDMIFLEDAEFEAWVTQLAEEAAERDSERAARAQALTEAKERATYEALKAKFEAPTTGAEP